MIESLKEWLATNQISYHEIDSDVLRLKTSASYSSMI